MKYQSNEKIIHEWKKIKKAKSIFETYIKQASAKQINIESMKNKTKANAVNKLNNKGKTRENIEKSFLPFFSSSFSSTAGGVRFTQEEVRKKKKIIQTVK